MAGSRGGAQGRSAVVSDGTAGAPVRRVPGLEDASSRHRLRHRAALLAAPALLTGALAGGIGWQGLSGDRVPPVASSPVATPPEPSDPGAETAPATPRPYLSMVVLPFAPLGGDAEQDQLADGITEEVTSAVALISGSFVIGRGAAFAYKGQAADARRIGRELGVRYVVQGSARREGPQVRINVQLLDAGTGAHLWADSFDEPLVGFAALTRAIASRIAATMSARLLEVGSDRMLPSERPQDADAVALTIRGRALLNRTSLEGTLEALRVTEQALLLDDRSPPHAHALMGHLLTTPSGRSMGPGTGTTSSGAPRRTRPVRSPCSPATSAATTSGAWCTRPGSASTRPWRSSTSPSGSPRISGRCMRAAPG